VTFEKETIRQVLTFRPFDYRSGRPILIRLL